MRIILFLLFTTAATFGWGQILTFDFAGIAGNEASVNSNTNNLGITASSITRGAGLTASGNGDRFNATNWAVTSIANAISGNDYMEFTITPTATCNFSVSSISIQLQRSATGPSAIVLRSSLDAFAANLDAQYTIADNTATQTFTFTFSQSNISVATTYRFYMYAEAGTGSGGIGDGAGNDLIVNGTTSCGSSNTITTGAITGSPFTVDCSTDDTGSIAFSSSGTFNSGNIYAAELSNAAGSFAAPVSIGTLSSTANTGSINITIPAATATGAGYLIRITASDPATIGTSSTPFTINLSGGPCTLTPPYMTSLIYDGCNVACSGSTTEGRSEIIFGNTGGYSVEVNPTNVNFIYNTNGNQPLTSGLVNNTTATSNLNTEAGCSGLFLDGFGQTLSPNTSFLVVSQNLCISSLIWSDLCGSGPIYVLYASASPTTWNDGGNFGNSSGTRNLQTIITSSDGSVHDISYSYTSVNGGDGSYATWSSDGGTPTTSGIFADCRLTPVALPSGISFFKAALDKTNAILYWQINSEQNNDYFTIAHSTSGYDFEVLGQVQGAGNSSTLNDYQLIHSRPAQGINYYKLTSTDFDGTTYTKGIVSLLFNSNGCYFDAQTSEIMFNERSDYRIFSMDGKLLGEVINETSLLFNQQGIVLIQDLRTGLTERLFVP